MAPRAARAGPSSVLSHIPFLTPDALHWYLTAFNIFCLAGWSYIFAVSLLSLAFPSQKGFYDSIGSALRYFETFAVFEVIHVIIGIVPSSLVANVVQGTNLGSRVSPILAAAHSSQLFRSWRPECSPLARRLYVTARPREWFSRCNGAGVGRSGRHPLRPVRSDTTRPVASHPAPADVAPLQCLPLVVCVPTSHSVLGDRYRRSVCPLPPADPVGVVGEAGCVASSVAYFARHGILDVPMPNPHNVAFSGAAFLSAILPLYPLFFWQVRMQARTRVEGEGRGAAAFSCRPCRLALPTALLAHAQAAQRAAEAGRIVIAPA